MWQNFDELPIHPSWKPALAPVADHVAEMGQFLAAEVEAGRGFLPAEGDVFRAFSYPFNEVKVLIMGQDPYPTPGHAMGLSFSVHADVRPLPRSLNNIFKELASDIGVGAAGGSSQPGQGALDLGVSLSKSLPELPVALPTSGDLTPWSAQGVALFNRVLTVTPGAAGSHKGKGWEAITEAAITALGERAQPLVAILWGKQAQEVQKFLGETPCICSVHPSPLSASRGFFGSKPFSQANEILKNLGATPINWQL